MAVLTTNESIVISTALTLSLVLPAYVASASIIPGDCLPHHEPVLVAVTNGPTIALTQAADTFPTRSVRAKFEELAQTWKRECELFSSFTEIIQNSAYQRIIAMGPLAIPLILRDLQREPNHWGWALMEITGENPISDDAAGRLDLITQSWLQWGRERGYFA